MRCRSPRQADGQLSADYSHYGRDWDDFLHASYDLQATSVSFLIGSPQAVVDKLGALREEGMRNFILWFNRGGAIAQKEVLRAMELFAAKVMPHLRSAARETLSPRRHKPTKESIDRSRCDLSPLGLGLNGDRSQGMTRVRG